MIHQQSDNAPQAGVGPLRSSCLFAGFGFALDAGIIAGAGKGRWSVYSKVLVKEPAFRPAFKLKK